jgi:hypothetical protein
MQYIPNTMYICTFIYFFIKYIDRKNYKNRDEFIMKLMLTFVKRKLHVPTGTERKKMAYLCLGKLPKDVTQSHYIT